MLPRLLEGMSPAAQALKMPCPIDMTQMADELIESHLAKTQPYSLPSLATIWTKFAPAIPAFTISLWIMWENLPIPHIDNV
ncbi:hypothetical protein B0F87_104212 [Methylobacter tundripaludum]|uniref:Uncharacterized protein n=1 Tax=Methylobacter tundripaludum TaxID=173365 RepID=A0A2S6HF97_9GAMM|nr:hypothetical protein [Methylobacter tundripaludum]PPK76120.1 hypothetical protein B0F87_104212 [Methylobacter tundripaludum]